MSVTSRGISFDDKVIFSSKNLCKTLFTCSAQNGSRVGEQQKAKEDSRWSWRQQQLAESPPCSTVHLVFSPMVIDRRLSPSLICSPVSFTFLKLLISFQFPLICKSKTE
ncbi:hypothetical protein SAY86_006074 [Trapa natans]|uniref:Uncharacterized protein n=1 Tax=Trapa natans TaxID=22666 RepID=A0AAN7QVL9_TRANT|nr:hypothetical protein SAY86_006074 [Trapa natans]